MGLTFSSVIYFIPLKNSSDQNYTIVSFTTQNGAVHDLLRVRFFGTLAGEDTNNCNDHNKNSVWDSIEMERRKKMDEME